MDSDFIIKLTSALYRVTEKFPKNEPLKFLLRDRACRVLTNTVLLLADKINLKKEEKKSILGELNKNISVLNAYFRLADTQQWVSSANFLVLEREYHSLEQEMREKYEKIGSSSRVSPSFQAGSQKSKLDVQGEKYLSERPKRILKILANKGKAQVWEFKKIFPNVSKRTLRRDFEHLLGLGLVQRTGEGNNTYYELARTN